mgnify:CR=1 FL=1
MNKVDLTGRLTKDPQSRWTNGQESQEQICIVRFTLAVNRRKKDAGADFISCVAFGKSAESLEKYCKKGTKLENFRQNTDGQLYQQRRRQSIYNRRHCRGMGVRRKQSGSRAAGKPASASTAGDRRKRFYEYTGWNRRRTAVFVKGGSRRTIKPRWRRHRAAQTVRKRNCNKTYRVV